MREIFHGFFFGFFFGGPREERKIAHPLFFAHFKQTVFSLSLFYFFIFFFTGASASRESLLALRRTRDLVRLKDSEKVFEKVFFFLFEEFEKQKNSHFFQPLSVWFHFENPTLDSKTKKQNNSFQPGEKRHNRERRPRVEKTSRSEPIFSPSFFSFLLTLSLYPSKSREETTN